MVISTINKNSHHKGATVWEVYKIIFPIIDHYWTQKVTVTYDGATDISITVGKKYKTKVLIPSEMKELLTKKFIPGYKEVLRYWVDWMRMPIEGNTYGPEDVYYFCTSIMYR